MSDKNVEVKVDGQEVDTKQIWYEIKENKVTFIIDDILPYLTDDFSKDFSFNYLELLLKYEGCIKELKNKKENKKERTTKDALLDNIKVLEDMIEKTHYSIVPALSKELRECIKQLDENY